jgi:hypothetical protein
LEVFGELDGAVATYDQIFLALVAFSSNAAISDGDGSAERGADRWIVRDGDNGHTEIVVGGSDEVEGGGR